MVVNDTAELTMAINLKITMRRKIFISIPVIAAGYDAGMIPHRLDEVDISGSGESDHESINPCPLVAPSAF